MQYYSTFVLKQTLLRQHTWAKLFPWKTKRDTITAMEKSKNLATNQKRNYAINNQQCSDFVCWCYLTYQMLVSATWWGRTWKNFKTQPTKCWLVLPDGGGHGETSRRPKFWATNPKPGPEVKDGIK